MPTSPGGPILPIIMWATCKTAAQGQPPWFCPWFNAWIGLVSPNVGLFVWLTRIINSDRHRPAVRAGPQNGRLSLAGCGLLMWFTAEGSGGSAAAPATLGRPWFMCWYLPAFLIFSAFLGRLHSDYYLERRYPAGRASEMGSPRECFERDPSAANLGRPGSGHRWHPAGPALFLVP